MNTGVSAGSKYDDQQRLEAAILFANKGTQSKVARLTGIPKTTIQSWSTTEWWVKCVEQVRSENKDRHIAIYDKIIRKATKHVLDKLPDASARDAMIIAATAQDKARILQSLPNSYQGEGSGIKALTDQFRQLSQQWEEKQTNVVSTQELVDNSQDKD